MERPRIRLDAFIHAAFLARKSCDPLSHQQFAAGEIVLACAQCPCVCYEETWNSGSKCPRCGSTSLRAEIPPPAQSPRISSFTATPNVLHNMGPVRLSWQVTGNATRIKLDGELCQGNQCEVHPIGSRRYTLRAENLYGADEAFVEIAVEIVPPTIAFFRASTHMREDGSPVELSWLVEGANEVRIEAGVTIDVETQGTMRVDPMTRTTYTLTAIGNWNARISEQLSVDITPLEPEITRFELQEQAIMAGLGSSLVWETRRTTSAQIFPVVIAPVPTNGKADIYPQEDTDYVLHVQDYFGRTAMQMVTIRVISFPNPSEYLHKHVEAPALDITRHVHPPPQGQQLSAGLICPRPQPIPLLPISPLPLQN